jgi:hypothetical protein
MLALKQGMETRFDDMLIAVTPRMVAARGLT